MVGIKLFLLGPPRIEVDGKVAEPDTRKAVALLAYLALSGERQPRDTLAAFLWPEFDDRRARAALRRTLSALKATIGEEPLQTNREYIAVELEYVWCDALVFREDVAASGVQHGSPDSPCMTCQEALETAASLYRDDFMKGFTLRDSVLFDDWQLQMAEDFRRDLDVALEQLVHIAAGKHEFEAGIEYARRWLQIDPLREAAHCQLMRLYSWSDKRSAALRQYRECVRILDEELGVSPLPETAKLYQDIQNDALPRPAVSQQQAPAEQVISRSNQAASEEMFGIAPFLLTGRSAEMSQMRFLYNQIRSDGRLIVIEGEPGVGKSRLAESLLVEVSADGAAILSARCYEGEANLAYAPIVKILRDGLERVDDTKLQTLSNHYLAEAARLLPQLSEHLSAPAPPILNAPGEQVRFYEGINQLLAVFLDGDAPGILWLDDVHLLDVASQELLLYLLYRWQNRPFLILLCWQAEELPLDNSLLSLATNLHRTGVCEMVRLNRFTASQTRELLAAAGGSYSPEIADRLYEETEGLPYFIVEYLGALEQQKATLDPDTSLPTPSSVRDLLHHRLMRITETERQVLQAASVIGHSFNYELVHGASGRSVEETVSALEKLSARGLIVEQGAQFDFSHHKLAALVYDEMGLARKRLLHRRMAEMLTERRTAPSAVISAQIASHYQHAGLEAEAGSYFIQAGDQARAIYAHQDAVHYYQSALALGVGEAWKLHAACGELYTRLGAYSAAIASYETAAALAPPSELGQVEHELAGVYQRQGNWTAANFLLTQAQKHIGDKPDPILLAQLTINRSLAAHRLQKSAEADLLAQQAKELAEASADKQTLALAHNLLGLLARSKGELDRAGMWLEKSRELADESHRLDIRIAARNNLALTQTAKGELDSARLNLEQALALCTQLGDRHHEAALRSNLADMLHQAGEEEAAQEQILQSVTIYADIGREENRWFAEIWQLIEW